MSSPEFVDLFLVQTGYYDKPVWMGIHMTNIVYIATSLDGFISPPDGSLEWLDCVPNPDDSDLGWEAFIGNIDALVMCRLTFETVLGFWIGWHYPVPGIVLSSSLKSVPEEFADQVQIANGRPEDIVALAHAQGFKRLYIDGGRTIQALSAHATGQYSSFACLTGR